jgi:mannose-6-phosphate isomerase-like protein (cupin superfamily)
MRAEFKQASAVQERETEEHCHILEVANDSGDELVSISRARVAPGVTTVRHRLKGISERYIIVAGKGRVDLDGLKPTEVSTGNVVRIPADTPQRISNTGKTDLIFYCVCSPRFRPDCYEAFRE